MHKTNSKLIPDENIPDQVIYMEKTNDAVERGQARIEFLALREEIRQLFDDGYTYAKAYRKLKNDGKITMSYVTFYLYVKGKSKIKKACLAENTDKKQENSEIKIENNPKTKINTEHKNYIKERIREEKKPIFEIEKDPEKQKAFF